MEKVVGPAGVMGIFSHPFGCHVLNCQIGSKNLAMPTKGDLKFKGTLARIRNRFIAAIYELILVV
jgi:hypothetical protein